MIFSDADIEMAGMHEDAILAYNGVCIRCTDALNPYDPKWAEDFAGRSYGPDAVATSCGPESEDYPGYHVNCIREMWED